jgi:hypothetical protein
VREDQLEALDKAFPEGYVIVYGQGKGNTRQIRTYHFWKELDGKPASPVDAALKRADEVLLASNFADVADEC